MKKLVHRLFLYAPDDSGGGGFVSGTADSATGSETNAGASAGSESTESPSGSTTEGTETSTEGTEGSEGSASEAAEEADGSTTGEIDYKAAYQNLIAKQALGIVPQPVDAPATSASSQDASDASGATAESATAEGSQAPTNPILDRISALETELEAANYDTEGERRIVGVAKEIAQHAIQIEQRFAAEVANVQQFFFAMHGNQVAAAADVATRAVNEEFGLSLTPTEVLGFMDNGGAKAFQTMRQLTDQQLFLALANPTMVKDIVSLALTGKGIKPNSTTASAAAKPASNSGKQEPITLPDPTRGGGEAPKEDLSPLEADVRAWFDNRGK